MQSAEAGSIPPDELAAQFDEAVRDTLARIEATGSPVITDGEQRKSSFATYPIRGLTNLAPGGVTIPFEDGHTRQLPVLTAGPFRYATQAWSYLDGARPHTTVPLKQAVISASAISLMYPGDGIPGYSRDEFIDDLVAEATAEIRGCLDRGAIVQIDFTEARLSLKLDPSGGLLNAFVDLNNRVLDQLTDAERATRRRPHLSRRRPGFDAQRRRRLRGAPPDAVPDERRQLLRPAGERSRSPGGPSSARRAGDGRSADLRRRDRSDRSPHRDARRGLRARPRGGAVHRPGHLGTTDDCGFSPFGDDTSTSRDTAFAKIAGSRRRDGDGVGGAGGLGLRRLRPRPSGRSALADLPSACRLGFGLDARRPRRCLDVDGLARRFRCRGFRRRRPPSRYGLGGVASASARFGGFGRASRLRRLQLGARPRLRRRLLGRRLRSATASASAASRPRRFRHQASPRLGSASAVTPSASSGRSWSSRPELANAAAIVLSIPPSGSAVASSGR